MKYLLLFFLISCANNQPQLDPQVFWKRDICFKLKKSQDTRFEKFLNRFRSRKYRKTKLDKGEVIKCGIAVFPELDEYNIDVISDSEMDRLEMTSCHEDKIAANADNIKKGIAEITYIPTIEKGEDCPIRFASFSRKRKFGFGEILLQHKDFQLEATIYCNGFIEKEVGIGACQSREGLIQKIEFDEPVLVSNPTDGMAQRKSHCPQLFSDGITQMKFNLPNRDCTYSFIGKNSKKIFNLHLTGYEDQPVKD